MSTVLQSPSYVIGPDGQPTAVLLDWATWKSIIEQLETSEDNEILRTAMTDIQMLARHKRSDLVLDPTYGIGTTAYLAKQWGRC